jgi:uncharacterized membrane protein YidH (DUF202 family)
MTPSPEWTPDHGASAERTRLAWRRTGLSASVVGLLALRPAFAPHPTVKSVLIAALAMATWATIVALSYRRTRGLNGHPPQRARRAVTAYALLTATFAVLGGLVVLR